MRNLLLCFTALAMLLLAGGCATIMRGNKQVVKIVSDPAGARLIVDNQTFTTPADVTLKRKQAHDITVSKEGYQAIRFKLNSHWDAGGAGAVVLDAAVPGGSALFLIDTLYGADRKFNTVATIKLPPAMGPSTQPITLYEYKGKLLEKPAYDAAIEKDKIFKSSKAKTTTTGPAQKEATTTDLLLN